MKICFYAMSNYWGGLRNCGGSKTTIMAANIIRHNGYAAYVAARKNKFTWFKGECVKNELEKDTDVVIACSISDVKHMHEHSHVRRKVYWMRALELWQFPKLKPEQALEKILNYLRAGQLNIVNSSWLKRLLEKYNIPCELCWQGVDINKWENAKRPYKTKTGIGAIYNSFHKTKRWEWFIEAQRKMGTDWYAYFGYGDKMWHNKTGEKLEIKFASNPSSEELKNLYNSCNIWFAPTILDSFHNPPLEAALSGCLVVCDKNETNGMEDYANDETAMRYGSFDEAIDCMRNPDYSKVPKMIELIKTKIGDRVENMKRLARIIYDYWK